MTKRFILLFFLALPFYILGQKRTILKGLVKIQNSYQLPLNDVSITAEGCNPNTSNIDGRFILDCPSKEVGEVIYNLVARKNGYEIVNDVMLENITIPKNGEKGIVIVMCKKGEIISRKKQFYRIAEDGIQKDLNFITSKLLEHSKDDSTKLYKEKYLLLERLFNDKEALKKKADEYARVDLDEKDERYRKVFDLFTNGKVIEANELMNTSEILGDIGTKKESVIKAQRDYDNSIKKAFLKADILERIGELDSALYLYEYATNLDTTNYYSVLKLIDFYHSKRDHNKVFKWINTLKSTKYSNIFFKEFVYHRTLGKYYTSINKNRLAKEALEKAKSIIPKFSLDEKIISTKYSQILTFYEELAHICQVQDEMDDAILYLEETKRKYAILAEKDSSFLIDLSRNLLTLGTCYIESSQNNLTYSYLQKSNNISILLIKKDSTAENLVNRIHILNTLAMFFSKVNKIDSFRVKLEEAITICNILVNNKNFEYERKLANLYHTLGASYLENYKIKEAIIPLRLALKFRRKIAIIDSSSIAPKLSNTLNSLGRSLVLDSKETQNEGSNHLFEGLKIREILFANEPESYVKDYCNSLNNIGSVYWQSTDFYNAMQYYDKSFQILLSHTRTRSKSNRTFHLLVVCCSNYINLCQEYYNKTQNKELIKDAIIKLSQIREVSLNRPSPEQTSDIIKAIDDRINNLNKL
jgi:tetratricopeptide (TPR) repeat protein